MMRLQMTGGPFDGVCLAMSAPYTPERIYLVPSPDPKLPAMLVGTDRLVPGPLFSDAVEYRLDRAACDLRDHPEYDGMEIGDAVYRHTSGASGTP
jgi:hypothetical protein